MGLSGTSRHSREVPGARVIWVVLVAAGTGERLGADRPKAFVQLAGRPLLAESLGRLAGASRIDGIVIAAPAGWERETTELGSQLGEGKVVEVVTGGATRAESVARALAAVPEEARVVVVHDAARALVDEAVLGRVLAALDAGWDGAIPGMPVSDTVKRVEGDRVLETLDRGSLVAAQTPQAFLAAALRAAFATDRSSATDCASLVERAGGRVVVVDGDPRLLKVTTTDDLERVERWLR